MDTHLHLLCINTKKYDYWRRLLRVPWTVRRSKQSILKEINPDYSSERLMLKLKLQYFGHLMQRTASLEETLILGKIEGRRRRGWQSMRWLGGITDLMDLSLNKLWDMVKYRETWRAAVHAVTKSHIQLSDWTTETVRVCWVLWETTKLSSKFFTPTSSVWEFLLFHILASTWSYPCSRLWLSLDYSTFKKVTWLLEISCTVLPVCPSCQERGLCSQVS